MWLFVRYLFLNGVNSSNTILHESIMDRSQCWNMLGKYSNCFILIGNYFNMLSQNIVWEQTQPREQSMNLLFFKWNIYGLYPSCQTGTKQLRAVNWRHNYNEKSAWNEINFKTRLGNKLLPVRRFGADNKNWLISWYLSNKLTSSACPWRGLLLLRLACTLAKRSNI